MQRGLLDPTEELDKYKSVTLHYPSSESNVLATIITATSKSVNALV